MNRRLLLVDGNNLAARCFHAMPELASEEGRTGAIYGFIKGLSWCRYQTKVPMHQTVVFWDGGRSEVRKKIYPDYKAGRSMEKEDREDYHRQIDVIREILEASGCNQIYVPGTEADDLIAIFCAFLRKQGDSAVIYSADGDFHQLFCSTILIFDPKKEMLGQADIDAKWNCAREKIVLKKALVGDSSDNIKGVPKIGDKRASLVVAYLGIRYDKNSPSDPGHSYRVCVEKNGWSEKDGKWIEHALEHKRLINRNIELMRLPQRWEESHYSDEQALDAMEQWLKKPKKNRRKFIELLGRYEMDSILENLANW